MVTLTYHSKRFLQKMDLQRITEPYKNIAEVDIPPVLGEITTACNVGQANPGHGACM